jgi:hypothetical protein
MSYFLFTAILSSSLLICAEEARAGWDLTAASAADAGSGARGGAQPGPGPCGAARRGHGSTSGSGSNSSSIAGEGAAPRREAQEGEPRPSGISRRACLPCLPALLRALPCLALLACFASSCSLIRDSAVRDPAVPLPHAGGLPHQQKQSAEHSRAASHCQLVWCSGMNGRAFQAFRCTAIEVKSSSL